MNIILITTAIYLVVGVLFSLFIKWGNETVVEKEERVHLGNKEHHVIALVWPMFLVVFVVSFGIAVVKKFINWF